MNWSTEQEQELRERYGRGESVRLIAAQMGLTKASVESKARRMELTHGEHRQASTDATERRDVDLAGDAGSVRLQTRERVRTEADAMRVAEVDPAVWEAERMQLKSWEAVTKDESGEASVTPMFGVTLRLRKKRGMGREEFRDFLLDSLRKTPRTKSRAKRPAVKPGDLLGELSIVDHHFGKLSWAPETGEDYDLEIARDRYDAAAADLVGHLARDRVARIVMVVGNDFYHVDGGKNMTTSGTPQDCDGRWQKSQAYGLRCVRDAINSAREVAPVDVVVVPGNHDEERAWQLGEMLAALYDQDSRVVVDNRPNLKKAYVWGKTFLGYYHGHHCRTASAERDVLNALAEQFPADFAAARWRELHMGHIHTERESVWHYRTSEDLDKVVVRRLPSLCGTDRWHHHQGYRSLKAAEAFVFDREHGRRAIYSTQPGPTPREAATAA